MRILIAVFLVSLLVACERSEAPSVPESVSPAPEDVQQASAKPPTTTPDPFEAPPGVSGGVLRRDDLVAGKPREHWLGTWGPPDRTTEFPMSRGLLEYQIELNNVFRPDDPETEKVEIIEDEWDEDGYTFVLWSFRKSDDEPWEAIQAMAYADGIEF